MSVLETLADGRKIFRVVAPALAADFQPGFALQGETGLWPVMRRDGDALWVVGAHAPAGDLTWQGNALQITDTDAPLFCCEDDQFFAVLAWLFAQTPAQRRCCTVLAGFSGALPFRPQPSTFLTPFFPPSVTAAVPLLEDWGVLSRIAHADGLPGCFEGDARSLLAALNDRRQGF